MAFFLLLWLLNATTEEQMAGLANYFSPTALSYTSSGAGGMLGGSSMLSPGPMSTSRSEAGVTVSLVPLNPNETPDTDGVPAEKTLTEDELEESGIPNAFEEPYESNLRDDEAAENSQIDADDLDETASQELLERLEQQDFERAESELREAISMNAELREFSQNLLIDMTPQGMRIQIADAAQRSMFPSGSSQMFDYTEELLGHVMQAILPLPNDIAVIGHTDSTPYHSDNGYSNWELSTDRANASRRALIGAGLPSSRIVRVVGKADTEPLDIADPASPQNRRISILILREGASAMGEIR